MLDKVFHMIMHSLAMACFTSLIGNLGEDMQLSLNHCRIFAVATPTYAFRVVYIAVNVSIFTEVMNGIKTLAVL